MTIRREGNYRSSLPEEVVASRIFKGSENPLTISRVYSKEFLCEFDMGDYPFDTQECSIVLVMKGNVGKFVDMAEGRLEYLGPIDLTQYFVKEMVMEKVDGSNEEVSGGSEGLKVDITLKRRHALDTLVICDCI